MAKLLFYYDLLSEPSRSVYIFLKLNDIPFKEIYVDLQNKKNLTVEYAKVNPFKLVPAIDDDGFKLYESVAILEYLADKNKVSDHWFPKDLKKRAKVNVYTSWHHSNIRKYCSKYVHCMFLQPFVTGKPIDQQMKDCITEKLNCAFNLVESIYLSKAGTFIAGEEEISIADLLLLNEAFQIKCFDFDLVKNRPRLESWMERTIQKLGPFFNEACADIIKLSTDYKEKIKLI